MTCRINAQRVGQAVAWTLGIFVFSCAGATPSPKSVAPQKAEVQTAEPHNKSLPALRADGDAPPISQDSNGVQYDRRPLGDARFDGAADNNWQRNLDNLCRDQALRPIVLDVDKTSVEGNFLNKVSLQPAVRDSIKALDAKHGVIFLSANFAVDRIAKFFVDFDYPVDAPLLARPRDYWQPDYEAWCHLDQRFAICESAYKSSVIQNLKSRCPKLAPVMVGVGDKFCDYQAYRQAGLCPIIVPGGKVVQTNASEREAGCVLREGADYAWRDDGKSDIKRCALVPERFIMSWEKAAPLIEALLDGSVTCGSW